MKVLIAEDHPVARRVLKQILQTDPDMAVVGEASDGHATMDLARKLDWDVAVVDYSMPGRGGVELVRALKDLYPNRPVLVLNMHPNELHAAQISQIFRARGSGYLNNSACDDLPIALKKVARGGKYIAPVDAEKLAEQFSPSSQKPLYESLSDREYRVMMLLSSGKQVSDIGKEMYLSPSTVSTYRLRILRKLGLANNAELVLYTAKYQLAG